MSHKYTCKKDKPDQRDFILKLSTFATPTVTHVDLRSQCPNVYNQGELGSCVSNGTAFSIQYDQIKYKQLDQFTPSRLFIYYNTRVIENTVNEDSGTTIRDAMKSVSQQGACPETIWPYDITKFTNKPPTNAYTSGLQHLVKTYLRVQLNLNQMKQCLIDGFPFVFGITLYSAFENVGSNGIVNLPQSSEQLLGGHCMACVGYDDSKQLFIVRNSWGDTWGDHGYCYIPYNYLCNSNYTYDVWTIRTITDTQTNTYTIQKALYGTGKRYIDVTNILLNFFKTGGNQLTINNRIFTDPYIGHVKQLNVTYTNGVIKYFKEGSIIKLSDVTSLPLNITKLSNIIKVTYGKNNRVIDVTNIVKNLFINGNTQFLVSNKLFTDPYVRVVKELTVLLSNGTSKVFAENDTVTFDEIGC